MGNLVILGTSQKNKCMILIICEENFTVGCWISWPAHVMVTQRCQLINMRYL